jgi:hypothetical protein
MSWNFIAGCLLWPTVQPGTRCFATTWLASLLTNVLRTNVTLLRIDHSNCTSPELRHKATDYEDQNPAKKNRTIRKTVARRPEEAGEAKTEIAGRGGRKGDESQ